MPTTEQESPPLIRLCGNFHGFLAGCHTQRPRGYQGLHPGFAGSTSGGRSSSPGSPSPPHCYNCRGTPVPAVEEMGYKGTSGRFCA